MYEMYLAMLTYCTDILINENTLSKESSGFELKFWIVLLFIQHSFDRWYYILYSVAINYTSFHILTSQTGNLS